MMIKYIVWTEEVSVNNELLDEQHQYLFQLINELTREKTEIFNPDRFAQTLSKLTDYCIEHFDLEESLMKKSNYPSIQSHIEDHNKFIKQIAMYNVNFGSANPTEPGEVIEFLIDWWNHHIRSIDGGYKGYV